MSARRLARRLVGIFLSALLAALGLVALLTVVIPFVLGAQGYTVLTGSMRPGLPPGTLVAARPTPIAQIRVGDVVTYQLRSGEPEVVTHRVVGLARDGDGRRMLITRGDANDVADASPVRAVQVRGVVVYAVPWVGLVNLWASPTTKSLLVTVAGLGAIGYGLVVLLRRPPRPPPPGSRRAARTARSATVVLAIAVMVAGAARAPGASADAPGIVASLDGRTWTAGALPLLDGRILVPGDVLETSVWIRSTASEPADVAILCHWEPDATGAAAQAVAAQLDVRVDGLRATSGKPLAVGRIEASSDRRIDLRIALPASSGNETRRARTSFSVSVTLSEAIGPAPEPSATATAPSNAGSGALPVTGGVVSSVLLVIATGAIALGIVLSRRRSPAATRCDRAAPDSRG